MRLSLLLAEVPVRSVVGSADLEVGEVTDDSRRAGLDALFVAIRGDRVDAHDLVGGLRVAAVAVERVVPVAEGTTLLLVQDTRRFLAQAAACLAGHPSRAVPVVGVTGTNGKTTTTTLIETALSGIGWRVGRVGTTGWYLGDQRRESTLTTPKATDLLAFLAELRRERARAMVMEVSSIGLDQRRVDGIGFHSAVFTNLTQDHLDYHHTMAAYAAAKRRLFQELLRPVGGAPRALLCADDPSWRQMEPPADRWLYGRSSTADLQLLWSHQDARGLRLGVRTPMGVGELESELIGDFNALNLLAALGVLLQLGLALDEALAALRRAGPVPGRLERVEAGGRGPTVLVDYAHTDDALRKVLAALRPLATRRLWVVFGAGGDRDRAKRPLMGQAAEAADQVVLTSDNPRSEAPGQILAEIRAGLGRPAAAWFHTDRAKAIEMTIDAAHPEDVVLIAGKGHETYQEIGGQRLPFDDRAVARQALLRRRR